MNLIDMPLADRVAHLSHSLMGIVLSTLVLLGFSVQPATAQDSISQQDKAMHYSLYYESFKNNEFTAAKGDLEWIIQNAPGFPKGDDRNFRRQFELYVGLADKAEKDEKRIAYLDTAATILATAPGKMDSLELTYDQFEWEIRKGRFLQEHQEIASSLDSEALTTPEKHYRKAFDLAPKKVNPYYIRQVIQAYLDDNKQSEALDFMEAVASERGDDEEVNKILSSMRDNVFGKNPQAKVQYLEKQYEAHPDSAQIMLSLFDAYVQQGNISQASKLAPELMKTNPPAETVREIAEMRLDDGRPKAALEAYDEAVEQGAELQAEDYFNRGQAYQQLNQFPQAREQYRRAIELDNSYAQAYIGIGDLYARAVSECSGSELSRQDKAVYWAAVDKYRAAIQADESISSVAKSKIQSYRKVFPTQEDIFYREDWSDGGTFTIDYGCYSWIGETTAVRQAP